MAEKEKKELQNSNIKKVVESIKKEQDRRTAIYDRKRK